MVSDFMPFRVLALNQVRKLFGIHSNDEECSGNLALFEKVEYGGRIARIRTIIESEAEELFIHCTGMRDHVGRGIRLILLAEIILIGSGRVDNPLTAPWCSRDTQ